MPTRGERRMRKLAGVVAVVGLGVLLARTGQSDASPAPGRKVARSVHPPRSPAALNDVMKRYCQRCHNETVKRGNLSLASFDVGAAHQDGEVAEKVIAKLRSGMMPPPGQSKPAGDTLSALMMTLESQLDSAAVASPNPGSRTFQRLNRD